MPFVKGDPRINRNGANKGSRKEKAFIEFYDEICEDIAKQNNMSVDDVRKIIYKVGYAKAKDGNYQFYKDILDRIHGTALNKHDIVSDGMPIVLPSEVIKQNESNSGTEDNSK